MKKNFAAMIVTLFCVCMLTVSAAAADAYPSEYSFYVDGRQQNIAAYTIVGRVHVNLRDLAMALKGTDKEFSVSWDAQEKVPVMTPGEPYVPVGGELQRTPELALGVERPYVYNEFGEYLPCFYGPYLWDGSNYCQLVEIAYDLDLWCGVDREALRVDIDTTRDFDYHHNADMHIEEIPMVVVPGENPRTVTLTGTLYTGKVVGTETVIGNIGQRIFRKAYEPAANAEITLCSGWHWPSYAGVMKTTTGENGRFTVQFTASQRHFDLLPMYGSLYIIGEATDSDGNVWSSDVAVRPDNAARILLDRYRAYDKKHHGTPASDEEFEELIAWSEAGNAIEIGQVVLIEDGPLSYRYAAMQLVL